MRIVAWAVLALTLLAQPCAASPQVLFLAAARTGGAPTIPATPTQSALTVGNGQLTANWTDVTGETSYTVFYSLFADLDATNYTYEDDGEGGFTPMAYPGTPSSTAGKITTAADAVAQVIAGLTNNSTYYVKLSATNAAGTSALSEAQSAAPHAPAIVSDPFATNGATLGTNWTKASWSTYSPKVANSQAVGTSGLAGQNTAYWSVSVNAFAANQYVEGTFTSTSAAGSSDSKLLLRVSSAQQTFYGVNSRGFVYKVVNNSGAGAPVANLSSALGAVTATDVIRLSVFGTVTPLLSLYKNGVLIGTYTDPASPITSGQPGLMVGIDTGIDPIDNFAAGDL